MNKSFHSNGKLLITAEYVVLDGAVALAIPTRFGQSLEIATSSLHKLHWQSFDEAGQVWYEDFFDIKDFKAKNSANKYSRTLSKILLEAQKLNPNFLSDTYGINVQTKLDFPRNWGLGTSSTLINNIAQWAKVDPFTLLTKSFGGSGYDIAAAQNNSPILFELYKSVPKVELIELSWNFTNSLFFVYLNQKQDSKQGITHYRKQTIDLETINRISEISKRLLQCKSLSEFEALLNLHEQIISKVLKLPTIKEKQFSEYPKTIKSLGAWGGDFVLVTGTDVDMDYFRNKGFATILPFDNMICPK